MAWFTLALGALLMAIGLGGQMFGIRKTSTLGAHDRPARNWIITVGSVVVGLWIIAFSAAHVLHHHHSGSW
jgi:hypothetical protein